MRTLFLISLFFLTACAGQGKSQGQMTLSQAVKSEGRTEAFTLRDKYRHPQETLEFFGIRADMTVIEISPGAGWYMEILAPFLNQSGQYIMATNEPLKSYEVTNNEKIQTWLNANPQVKAKLKVVSFNPPSINLGKNNSADMVLTFRNAHNWISKKAAEKAFKAFYNVLKPGGVLGVVDHRSPESIKDPLVKSGYVRESVIIKLAQNAGFKLDAKSEINANPKDKTLHPRGVWTLPPSLRLGGQNKERYEKIGESDRMTIRFIKPMR